MQRPKIKLTVGRKIAASWKPGTPQRYDYVVIKATNTTEQGPDDVLTEATVDSLIRSGVEVTVTKN